MKLYKNKIMLLAALIAVTFFFAPIAALAQAAAKNIEIEGVVTDENKVPLVGASVIISNTVTGTVTSKDGKFKLSVPANASLQISYIGYDTKVVAVGNRTSFNIVLATSAEDIGSVVVLGYGTISKKDMTGAAQSIGSKELVKSMNTNVSESLNGRVSGVLVNKTSNRPGADMNIVIRGLNSITSSNEPLYVIDGVTSQTGMRHLNAADIESIDILKDASSCAIYGSRGANGVVIITTKGANKKEGFSVEYSGYVGIKTPTNIPDMIGDMGNGMEYVDYRINLWTNKYGAASLSRPDFLTNDEKMRIRDGEFYDWLREVASTSMTTSHSVIGSGGTEKTSYSVGLSYLQDQGFIGSENYTRYTANIGLEHRVSKKFTLGLTSYISMNNTDLGANDALLNAYLLPSIVSPYDKDGSYLFNCQPTSSKLNPFVQMDNNLREKENFYANIAGFLEYKPLDWLSVKTQVAIQYDTEVYGEWVGKMTQQNMGVNAPNASRSEAQNMNVVWDNIVTLNKTFNKKHKINAIALFSMQQDTHKSSAMSGEGLPYESLWHAIGTADKVYDVKSNYWESAMISAMLRANYTFNDRYMLTVTGRYDGTSRLAIGNQWGLMPSAALGWQMKKENFLKDVNWLSELKLRASWGKSGNNNFGHDITMVNLNQSRYWLNGKGENGFGFGDIRGSRDLQWEMTKEWNLGVDFGFLNNRITGSVDAYSRKTEDLIMKRSVGSVNGYNQLYQNIATTSNKGIEISINSVNVSTSKFTWKTNFTFSLNKNKIVDLYGDNKDDLANKWFIGHSLGAYYDLKQLGIWQEWEADEAEKYSAKPGHIKVWDKDENGTIDERDFTILGARVPDWTAGMTNTFTYRNFDLSIYMYARVGGIYSDDFQYMFTAWDNEHWNKLDVPYWTPENANNKWPAVGSQSYNTQVLGQVKGDFLKIQNITLGYTLPASATKKMGIKSARAYVAVQNPFTFSDYVGSDPEIIGENVYTQMSLYPMTFSLGLNFNF